MSTKTKKKLCWNCEGNVSLENETCPYCGVSLDVSPLAGIDPNKNTFVSPFKSVTSSNSNIPKPPYTTPDPEQKEAEMSTSFTESDFAFSDLHRTLLTIVSLSLGTILFLFGGILFLFSNAQGLFTLSWNGAYWFVYLMIGIPLIYIGWKTMSHFNSQENESPN